MEPAQELTGRSLHCGPETEPFEPLVVAKEHRDDPGPDLVAGSRPAAIEEAHDLRIAVQLDQVVFVGLGETAQREAIGVEENPHPETLAPGKDTPAGHIRWQRAGLSALDSSTAVRGRRAARRHC